MATPFSLGKAERIKSRKLAEVLFAQGKSQSVFPIRVTYMFLPLSEGEKSGLQIGVTVGKKHFKKAVQRNRIKRLLREAYRLQKVELLSLLQEKGLKGYVFFMYVDKTLPSFDTIFVTTTKCLKLLQKRAMQTHEKPT